MKDSPGGGRGGSCRGMQEIPALVMGGDWWRQVGGEEGGREICFLMAPGGNFPLNLSGGLQNREQHKELLACGGVCRATAGFLRAMAREQPVDLCGCVYLYGSTYMWHLGLLGMLAMHSLGLWVCLDVKVVVLPICHMLKMHVWELFSL